MKTPKFEPLETEAGSFVFGGLVSMIVSRLRLIVYCLDDSSPVDNGFLAGVYALRTLAEANTCGVCFSIALGEIDEWEEKYLAWLEKKRFSKKVKREALIQCAKEEFARIRKHSFPAPGSVWRIEVQQDLFNARKAKEGLPKPKGASASTPQDDEWSPCKLVKPADGGTVHSLIFNQFKTVDSIFEQAEVPNDGYAWTDLVKGHIGPRYPATLKKLEFDPESSLFAVRSSDLLALRDVKIVIESLLRHPSLLRERLGELSSDAAN